ncbi:hypothetical protein ABVT39_000613 [Epinephelus coioides]
MASSWRSPYPKQQNPGLTYQERPAMPEQPDHFNPSPRLTNRPPFPYVPQGGAPIEAHWYQYAPMTSPGTYVPPLMQPPLTNIPNWTPMERHLCELQNETQLVDDLHTQLYDVPAKFYHHLKCSLPLELRHSLCKLRHYTYKRRMVENCWGLKEQHERDQQEKINLRAQVHILTGDNQNLRKQLASYRELELEIAVLKDQVAAYRRLRRAGTSAYVSTDSTDQ